MLHAKVKTPTTVRRFQYKRLKHLPSCQAQTNTKAAVTRVGCAVKSRVCLLFVSGGRRGGVSTDAFMTRSDTEPPQLMVAKCGVVFGAHCS